MLASLSAGLSLAWSGCSLDSLLPTTALDAGAPTLHVKPVLHRPKTRSLPAGITRIEFEVVDVLLHRKATDSWNILNDQSAKVVIDDGEHALPAFSAVPLAEGEYDRIRVVLDNAKVVAPTGPVAAHLAHANLELEQVWQLSGDQRFDLHFELGGALTLDDEGGYQLDPALDVQTRHDDFSGETLNPGQDEAAPPAETLDR